MHQQGLYRVKKHRISLTALIDVVFILLLFFMLTTSFSQWRAIHISTATSIEADHNKEVVSLLLMPDETVKHDAKNVTFQAYQAIKLKDLGLQKVSEVVVLLPHQEVPLQLLVDVTQHLKAIGLQHVSIGHSFGEELNVFNHDKGVQ